MFNLGALHIWRKLERLIESKQSIEEERRKDSRSIKAMDRESTQELIPSLMVALIPCYQYRREQEEKERIENSVLLNQGCSYMDCIYTLFSCNNQERENKLGGKFC